MAPLRSPSSSMLDDSLSFDPEFDPLDPLDPVGFPSGFDRSPSAAFDRLVERWPWLPTSAMRLFGGLLALAVLAAAGWWLLRPAPVPVEKTLPMASATGTPTAATGTAAATTGTGAGSDGSSSSGVGTSSTTIVTDLVVQAAGAVNRPGVYRLAGGARVDDLVRAAGGLLTNADGDRVNLAAPLADGARVWIPAQGETEVPEVVAGGTSGGAPATGGAGSASTAGAASPQVVDLNTATAEQLDTLPGVGPSTAAAILAYRSEHGPFSSVDDLLEVRGIGDAKLEQIRPQARV